MQRILVVDDEPAIVTLLTYNLKIANYEVETASSGPEAVELAVKQPYDAILLDVMLPGYDGAEVTKRLRQERVSTPIIMITAKADEFDKILGLELGADDYITKPFSPREVLARLKAVLRRYHDPVSEATGTAETDQLQVGQLNIDLKRVTVQLAGKTISLTPKEFELLVYLVQRPDQVFSREQLLNGVWGYDYSGETRMIDIHISHLREKLEKDPKHPAYLQTVRGFGYRFEVPASD